MTHLGGPAADLYRQYFERTGDAFLIIEGDTFVDCNQATVDMLRYRTRDELLQSHPSELSPEYQPDGRRSFDKANEMMALAFERGSHRFEWDHRRADGEVFPVEVLLTAVAVDDRRVLHCVWRDLSERRRLEAELVQAHKMEALGRLSSGIAHDFNNLLVAIIGNAELLLTDLEGQTEPQTCAAEILKAGHRARDLVAQLLAFSRRQVLRPRTLDLADAVADLSAMVRRLLGDGVDTQLVVHDRPLWVSADPGQVSQVVLNLAANARDALAPGGRFRLAACRVEVDARTPDLLDALPPGTYARLTAEDDGEGIAPADLPRIFEPFFTTKPAGRGTGLGLATVYGIVRQSGGSVAVRSAPGVGTCFSAYLPLVAAPRGPDEPGDAPARDGARAAAGATVLLVEDEASTSRLVRVMLEREGFRVEVAGGGEAALAALSGTGAAIDLLLTDIVMPGMDGAELARRVRALRPELPILLTSGYPAEFLAEQGEDLLDEDIIQKPFSARDLIARVRAALARARGA